MTIECGVQLELSLCIGNYALIKKMSEDIECGTTFKDNLIAPRLESWQQLIITDVNLMATLCTEDYELKISCIVTDMDRAKHAHEATSKLLDTK